LSEPGQGSCIGHDVCRHARFEGSAHDLSGEPIENDGQGEPAFIGSQVGYVRRPDLVRCRRREVPVEPIGRYRQTVFGVRRDLGAPLVTGREALLAHPSFYPFLARRRTPGTPFAPPTGTAVGPLEFGVNGSDERPLESSVLCSQTRQFHFFRGHPSAARAVQLALGRGFPPVASGLGAPSERLDHNTHALPVLDPFDRQFLELSAVGLLRQFHLWSPKLRSILRHLWLTNFRRNLKDRLIYPVFELGCHAGSGCFAAAELESPIPFIGSGLRCLKSSVAQGQHTLGTPGQFQIVRYDHKTCAPRAIEGQHQLENIFCCLSIKVAGWLVG
jgi:hypothetical protein